jgi:hypothetical protein
LTSGRIISENAITRKWNRGSTRREHSVPYRRTRTLRFSVEEHERHCRRMEPGVSASRIAMAHHTQHARSRLQAACCKRAHFNDQIACSIDRRSLKSIAASHPMQRSRRLRLRSHPPSSGVIRLVGRSAVRCVPIVRSAHHCERLSRSALYPMLVGARLHLSHRCYQGSVRPCDVFRSRAVARRTPALGRTARLHRSIFANSAPFGLKT